MFHVMCLQILKSICPDKSGLSIQLSLYLSSDLEKMQKRGYVRP